MLSVKWSSDFSEIKSLSFGPGQAKYEIPQNNHLFNNRSTIKAGGGVCVLYFYVSRATCRPPFLHNQLENYFKNFKKVALFLNQQYLFDPRLPELGREEIPQLPQDS